MRAPHRGGLWKLPRLTAVVEGPRKARPAFGRSDRASRRPPTTALENRRRFPTVAWKTEDGFPQFPQPRRRRAMDFFPSRSRARYAGQNKARLAIREVNSPTSCEIAAAATSRVAGDRHGA